VVDGGSHSVKRVGATAFEDNKPVAGRELDVTDVAGPSAHRSCRVHGWRSCPNFPASMSLTDLG
jgi:hypothetical protein